MEGKNLTAANGDFGEIESYADDDYGYDETDDGLIDCLDNFETNNFNSQSFKGLDGVRFDDEDDDDDDEELKDLFSSTNGATAQALVPHGNEQEDDEAEICSDEEQDILKGIKDDVELKVREEMEEELKGYKERMKAIEEGRLPGRTDDEKTNDASIDEKDEMTPQLREAIIKMNKLDKILRKKVKREKEVKRERIILERRMRQEISEMEQGASKFREIKINTERFLALAPPPSHNEGVSLESEDEEEMPPLFQTQFDESELDRRKNKGANAEHGQNTDNDPQRSGSSISSQGNKSRASKSGINTGSQSRKQAKKKDFIKRNKELAGEADQPVAMTDDEKRRLQSLLEGVDELPEIEEGEDIASLMEMNPFQLSLQPGEGFCPDVSESRTLSSIDQRLKGLMPEDDFKSIFNRDSGFPRDIGAEGDTPSQRLFTRVGLHSTGNDAAALDRFGERVLYETKEERELKARLLAIESQLEQFKTPKEMEEDEPADDCHLTDQQLDELLDQCARNMGHTIETDTPGSTPRSQLSSRQSLMANPPRLTDEQLQQLLSDAQFPLSSRLLALRDDDQKLEEEDGSTEMIRAETWIAIRDAKLDENIVENEEAQALQLGGMNELDKTRQLEGKCSSKLSNSSRAKLSQENSKNDNEISQQNGNLSTNNTYRNDEPGVSSKTENREIDDFAFTPDITNPVYVSDSPSAFHEHPRNGEADRGRDMEVRRDSGGARAKTGGSVGLPKLPHPPQLSSSSSSMRELAESEASCRVASSSLVSSSRESFDSFFPSNNNNNGSQDGAQHPIRLPEISPNSFLIHTPQGMNNEERTQPRPGLPSRPPPLNMVRNNLSDMSVTSMSASDREDNATPTAQASSVGQNSSASSAGRRVHHTQMRQPNPPSIKKPT